LALTFVTHLPLPSQLMAPGLFVSVLVIVLAAFQSYKAAKEKIPQFKIGLWLFYLSFTPALLLWLFSQWRPVYLERALLPSHVVFCIWLAWVFIKTPAPKWIRLFMSGLLLIGMAVGLYEHYTYQGFPYAPYQAMDNSLSERVRPGDVIIHSNKITYLPALYFDSSLPQLFIIDIPGSKTDTLAEPTSVALGLRDAADIQTASINERSIWFVIFQKEIDEEAADGNPPNENLQYLLDHFQLSSTEAWGEIWLYHFQSAGQ
jgi:hypothetical protein